MMASQESKIIIIKKKKRMMSQKKAGICCERSEYLREEERMKGENGEELRHGLGTR